jgi:hypothetical protein
LSIVEEHGRTDSAGPNPARIVSQIPLQRRNTSLPPPSLPLPQQKLNRVETGTPTKLARIDSIPRAEQGFKGTQSHESELHFPDTAAFETTRLDALESSGLSANTISNWKLIYPYLGSEAYWPIPLKRYMPDLLPLPRARDIQLRERTKNGWLWSMGQDTDAILIQLTGKQAREPCQRCQEGKGPFKSCVVVSPNAPQKLRDNVKSCANCYYKGKHSKCSFVGFAAGELASETTTTTNVGAAIIEKTTAGAENPRATRLPSLSDAAQPIAEAASMSVKSQEGHTPRQLRSQVRASQRHADINAANSSITAISETDDMDDLPVENWELAPGRVRNVATQASKTLHPKTTPMLLLYHPSIIL